MRRWLSPLILVGILVGVVIAWSIFYGFSDPFDDFVGEYPWDDRGRYRGYSIPLKPDKIALFCGFFGALSLLGERLLPRRADGSRTKAARALLVFGVLALFPLGVRLFAIAMGLFTLLVGLLLAAGVLWLVYKFITHKPDVGSKR